MHTPTSDTSGLRWSMLAEQPQMGGGGRREAEERASSTHRSQTFKENMAEEGICALNQTWSSFVYSVFYFNFLNYRMFLFLHPHIKKKNLDMNIMCYRINDDDKRNENLSLTDENTKYWGKEMPTRTHQFCLSSLHIYKWHFMWLTEDRWQREYKTSHDSPATSHSLSLHMLSNNPRGKSDMARGCPMIIRVKTSCSVSQGSWCQLNSHSEASHTLKK